MHSRDRDIDQQVSQVRTVHLHGETIRYRQMPDHGICIDGGDVEALRRHLEAMGMMPSVRQITDMVNRLVPRSL